ncbi:Gfo/Idh/MocA family oxidoreductase [Candidatus Nitronereus thalassa]|uniref:Gfo/Idh/MocA family oxidoreductase n=1 Tax=Candidatus Nitronereus thalassa TaxID=3020898 RepID=A0ABU3K619_9BACT|nr:Gfo/Idh/MocA family oxidoreductase [Candidatus Nitronereus thalassa]MDT7041818.1 Gfo/Idh/MocA family oxidoreductase [Candidatus Nitronereus thalassa]
MDKLRVGVIGVGHLGQHHARLYSQFSDVQLMGITDLDPDRASVIGQQHGVAVIPDMEALLKLVDAVSVAVPTSYHRAVVMRCLEAGVHVLVEKPLASLVEDAQAMVHFANQQGLTLQVGHVERFNPIMDVIRGIVRAPGFIECHRLAPYQLRGTDVDVVLDLMIHDLDLILSLKLGDAKKVEAVGVAVLSSRVDFANARVEFSDGCIVSFTASRMSTGRLRKMRLFQSDLYLSVDYQSRQGIVYRRVQAASQESTVVEESIRGNEEEPLKRELLAFVQSIQTGISSGVSGEEGLAAMELAQKIIASIHKTSAPDRLIQGAGVSF